MAHAYTGVDNLETMREAKNYHAALINLVYKAIPKDSRQVVDFGAGLGTYAEGLRDKKLEVLCIENDQLLLQHLKSQGFTSEAEIKAIKPASQSCIYSLNVLEHVKDDTGVVQQLGTLLQSDGRLVLYLPAFSILYSSMDKKVGHYRRYRLRPLVKMLKAQGFEVVQARYIDSLGFLATLAFKVIGNQNGDINLSALKIYDRYFFPISQMLDLLVGRWFGKNVFVVVKKANQ